MRLNLNIGLVFLLTEVICMFNFYGCSGNFKYEKYSSKDAEININMDYLSGWLYSEQKGSYGSFAQVVFYHPDNKERTFKAGMVVTVERSSKVGFQPFTIEAMADDLLQKRLKFKDTRVLSKSQIELSNIKALDIKLNYKRVDKLYSTDVKLIPVTERIVIFKKGDKFYTLRYENREEDFDKLDRAFSHMINSIRFKDNS